MKTFYSATHRRIETHASQSKKCLVLFAFPILRRLWLWNNPHAGLTVDRSSSENPVVTSNIRASGHFTSRMKKLIKNNKQWEEGRKDSNGFSTANHKKMRCMAYFWYSVYACAFGYHKCHVKLPTATKNADSSLHCSTSNLWLLSSSLTPCSRFCQRGQSDCSRPSSSEALFWLTSQSAGLRHNWIMSYALFHPYFWSRIFANVHAA